MCPFKGAQFICLKHMRDYPIIKQDVVIAQQYTTDSLEKKKEPMKIQKLL